MKKLFGYLLLAAVSVLAVLPWVRDLEHGPLDDAARRAAPGQFVRLAHGDVHYRLSGPEAGTPVLLVHGFSVPSYVWEPLDERLAAAGFRVVRFDLYGRGWSDRPDVVYDRDLFATQLLELMDALHIPRAHVIGLSMGGAIVARFARDHPQRVMRVGLVSPLTRSRDISPLHLPIIGEWFNRVVLLPRLAAGQMSDFAHPERHAGWTERFQPQLRYDGFGRAILSTLRHVMTQDSLGDFIAVGTQSRPVLLVWGRQDSVVPFEHSDAVRGAIPGIQFLAVDDAGHLPHREQPDAVAARVIAFLQAENSR